MQLAIQTASINLITWSNFCEVELNLQNIVLSCKAIANDQHTGMSLEFYFQLHYPKPWWMPVISMTDCFLTKLKSKNREKNYHCGAETNKNLSAKLHKKFFFCSCNFLKPATVFSSLNLNINFPHDHAEQTISHKFCNFSTNGIKYNSKTSGHNNIYQITGDLYFCYY